MDSLSVLPVCWGHAGNGRRYIPWVDTLSNGQSRDWLDVLAPLCSVAAVLETSWSDGFSGAPGGWRLCLHESCGPTARVRRGASHVSCCPVCLGARRDRVDRRRDPALC